MREGEYFERMVGCLLSVGLEISVLGMLFDERLGILESLDRLRFYCLQCLNVFLKCKCW